MKLITFVKPVLVFNCLGLIILNLSRFFLFITHLERVTDVESYGQLFLIGLRFDIILLSYLSILPFLILLITPKKWFQGVVKLLSYYFLVFLLLLLFSELATPDFVNQYDTRPNRIFLDYLIYPKEVLGTLVNGYLTSIIITFITLGIAIFLGLKFRKKLFYTTAQNYKERLIVFPVIAFLLVFGARSSLTSKRPINASNAVFSTDQMVNSLALNSLYTIGFAAYSIKDEENILKMYGKMSIDEAVSRVQKYTDFNPKKIKSNDYDFFHPTAVVNDNNQKYNVVIFLQESLGAEYVGALGGLPLTPELDKLTQEGLLFTNLYCTGTRSVRGIEAVVSGFMPTPSESVVKLSNAQNDFFTLASIFKKEGFDTSFIYGGMANFDNMASFFSGNGFENIIDETDFDADGKKYAFKGTWGYSDEDLVTKANDYFKTLGDKPFFSLLFSTSNHDPFEFPDNRIELYDKKKNTVNNAIKYADFSIGKFLALAKKEAYFKNTIFIIISDHNTRTYGNNLVPIKKFRIPALLIGPNIPKGQRYKEQASQIDIPTTILGYCGMKNETPMLGRNLTQDKVLKPRSLMQFHDNFGFRVENDLVILMPKAEPKQFKVEKDSLLLPNKLNKELANDALAHLIIADYLYKSKKYSTSKK